MVEIYSFKINNENEELFYSDLKPLISIKRQDIIKRFRKVDDAKRSILSEILIRMIIMKRFKLKNEEINFNSNCYGKPFFNGVEDFHYNISHSGDWIICAINNMEIGIDIEKIQPVDFEIAEQFFSKEEYYDLMRKKDMDRIEYFYELWTLKESYIKAIGKGLSIPLNSFSLSVENKIITLDNKNKENKDFYFKQYNIDSNYKMAVCCYKEEFCIDVTQFTVEDQCQQANM
jgi:4'-phosphopantetheinyl transferase